LGLVAGGWALQHWSSRETGLTSAGNGPVELDERCPTGDDLSW
jgi:hypothetical protein